MEKYNLKNIIANVALSTGLMFGISGCSFTTPNVSNLYNKVSNSFSSNDSGYNGKQPITLKNANFYKGPINKFVSNYTNVESKRDAATVDREKRCLEDMVGKPFTSKNNLYSKLDTCVSTKRRNDMIEYGIGSVLIDGLKVYLLFRGTTGSSSSSTTSTTPTTPTTPVIPVTPVTNIVSGTSGGSKIIYNAIK